MYLLNFFPVYLSHSSGKHVFSSRGESSVDPDQMALSADLYLQCLQKRISRTSVIYTVHEKNMQSLIQVNLNRN